MYRWGELQAGIIAGLVEFPDISFSSFEPLQSPLALQICHRCFVAAKNKVHECKDKAHGFAKLPWFLRKLERSLPAPLEHVLELMSDRSQLLINLLQLLL